MSLSSDEQHCERPLLVCVQYADDATTCAQGYFLCVVKTKQYISGVGQFLFIPISKNHTCAIIFILRTISDTYDVLLMISHF